MIVGIEARVALLANRGWARYTREIIKALSAIGGLELRVLAPENSIAHAIASQIDAKNVRFIFVDFDPLSPDEYWTSDRGALAESFLEGIDVLHSMTRFLPPTKHASLIATVHDIAPLSDPPYKPQYRAATIRALQTLATTRARIVAVSAFTKRELSLYGGLDVSEVTVIPNGVADVFFEAGGIGDVGPAAPPVFFLHVGGVGPNKNFDRLFEAARVVHERRGVPLVSVGDASWGYDALLCNASPAPWMIHSGFIDDRGLASLYRRAAALVFPSLHEGFGLPVAEAMACGTPVLCSRIPVLEEIAGDCALYFEPASVSELIQGLERLLDDQSLSDMRARARQRAQSLTWSSAAHATLEVYHRALAR